MEIVLGGGSVCGSSILAQGRFPQLLDSLFKISSILFGMGVGLESAWSASERNRASWKRERISTLGSGQGQVSHKCIDRRLCDRPLFITCMVAILSQWKRTLFPVHCFPQMMAATAMGNNSRNAIDISGFLSTWTFSGHLPRNHLPPKISPVSNVT